MRIDLGRRDVGVAEHFLDGAEVGPALEQVGGKGMAEGMRRDGLLDAGSVDVASEDFPGTHARERLATSIQEEDALPLPFLEFRALLADVGRNGRDRGSADGHEALLAAFAENTDQLLLENEVAHAERDPFGDTKTGAIGQLEHRAIAEDEWVVEARRGEEALDFDNA